MLPAGLNLRCCTCLAIQLDLFLTNKKTKKNSKNSRWKFLMLSLSSTLTWLYTTWTCCHVPHICAAKIYDTRRHFKIRSASCLIVSGTSLFMCKIHGLPLLYPCHMGASWAKTCLWTSRRWNSKCRQWCTNREDLLAWVTLNARSSWCIDV